MFAGSEPVQGGEASIREELSVGRELFRIDFNEEVLVIFDGLESEDLAVGAVLGGWTGGGGGDSTPPAAQDPAATASLTFQWDPVAVSDLAGYKIYR
ncbi:MAG TPA: hypothetical protein VF443_06160 [Nitrospira sp.]